MSDSRIDRSSDSVATAEATAAATERHKRQQSDSGATAGKKLSNSGVTAERQLSDIGATAERQQIDSRGDIRSDCAAKAGATSAERQRSDSGAKEV